MKDFVYEICILVGIALYIVNMVIGARTNRQIANKWCMMYGIGNGILPQQFAHVGVGELSTPALPQKDIVCHKNGVAMLLSVVAAVGTALLMLMASPVMIRSCGFWVAVTAQAG